MIRALRRLHWEHERVRSLAECKSSFVGLGVIDLCVFASGRIFGWFAYKREKSVVSLTDLPNRGLVVQLLIRLSLRCKVVLFILFPGIVKKLNLKSKLYLLKFPR